MNRSPVEERSWRALRSGGAGMRVNARGFVAEIAGAHRFSTLTPGWTFAFNLRPAF